MAGQLERGRLEAEAVVESARAERVRREELELARREAMLEALRPPRLGTTALGLNDLLPREIVLP